MTHVGRNAPCPCGSGKKYKRCCGAAENRPASPSLDPESELFVPSLESGLERQTANLGKLLATKEFESVDQINRFMEQAMASGTLGAIAPETDVERAQDVMYDAWDAPDPWERIELARKALAISPDCADAYVLLAEESAWFPEQKLELYRDGVAAGERGLGANAREEFGGHYWGVLETRPYMRARQGLARTLWDIGDREEAIRHYEDMLTLNPGDNQGIRYQILTSLIITGNHRRARELMASYPDEWSPAWGYGGALIEFARHGATTRANDMLKRALERNAHVPLYLLGYLNLPPVLPEYLGIGDHSEAAWYAFENAEAWQSVPGALKWLDQQFGGEPEELKIPKFKKKAHKLFYNMEDTYAFTRCPECDRPTKVRRQHVTLKYASGQYAVVNTTVKLCDHCDLMIARYRDVWQDLALTPMVDDPSRAGVPFRVIGTMERPDGRQAVKSDMEDAAILKRTIGFKEEVAYTYEWPDTVIAQLEKLIGEPT